MNSGSLAVARLKLRAQIAQQQRCVPLLVREERARQAPERDDRPPADAIPKTARNRVVPDLHVVVPEEAPAGAIGEIEQRPVGQLVDVVARALVRAGCRPTCRRGRHRRRRRAFDRIDQVSTATAGTCCRCRRCRCCGIVATAPVGHDHVHAREQVLVDQDVPPRRRVAVVTAVDRRFAERRGRQRAARAELVPGDGPQDRSARHRRREHGVLGEDAVWIGIPRVRSGSVAVGAGVSAGDHVHGGPILS